MDALTQLISDEIKKQYKSVRQFASVVNIPQTTLASTLKNGVKGTAYETVVKICNSLNIKLVNHEYPILLDEETLKALDIYSRLDEKGRHTVNTILRMEHDRLSYDITSHKVNSVLSDKN